MNTAVNTATGGWTPKLTIIVTSILSAAGAAGLSTLGGIYLWDHQTTRSERASDVSKFIEVSQQFDRTVRDFMGPFSKGADDSDEREALRNNIHDQFLALERASAILPEGDASRVERYKERLVAVGTEIDKGVNATEAQGLVQSFADAREANVCVTFDLRAAAGMDVSPEDRLYCGSAG
jgi:Ni,Fe-hydrogenase III component G